jgi:plastocyanin
MRAYLVAALSVGVMAFASACGDDGGSTKTPDAPAATSHVSTVTCTGSEMTIMTTGTTTADFAYDPTSLTITVGSAVKFVMPDIHDVVADTGGDPGLSVDFSETKCLKFDAAGTYKFHCGPHKFEGTITVQ